MNSIQKELEHLTSISALSGMEDRMIAEMQKRFKPLADAVDVDRLGNVTATFNGKSDTEPKLLVFAHVDEVGMMITKIDPNGFLRFDRIGGVPEKTLRGQFVNVFSIDGEKCYTGFIGTHAHHLTPADQKYVVPTTDKMYIDMGFTSAKEALDCGIRTGSAVTYEPRFHVIGENRITSKTMDNRVGVYLLLSLAEYLKENKPIGTVYLVASVQEEFNIRGNMPVFTRLEPDAAICLDITSACDTPDLNGYYDISLGKGPAVLQMNFHGRGTLAGLIPHPKFRLFIERTIEDLKIPYQRQVIIGEITDDAFTLVLGKQGVAMAHISIPMRYSHSPVETCDIRDIKAGDTVVKEVVKRFNHSVDLNRGTSA
jgi:putative aminopeptidase FrvX